MNLIDFHCDTIGECYNQNLKLFKNNLHIDIVRAQEAFHNYCQVFAIWIPDELRGEKAFGYYNNVYKRFLNEVQENKSNITFCRTYSEMKKAFSENKISALLSVEGGAVLAGDIDKIQYLHDCGVKFLTLTWNGKNELGDGCMAENSGGLTEFGKLCITELESTGIIIDVSHLSQKGFYDVAEYSTKPFVATHSNCNIVDNSFAKKRNLSDEQVKVIISKNGIMGINLCADFLGNDNDTGCDAVARQIDRFLKLGAENNVCFGCDFDGCTVNNELAGIDRLYVLFNYLLKKNFSEDLVNKIFFLNAKAFIIANI